MPEKIVQKNRISKKHNKISLCLLCLSLFAVSSCADTKKVVYFNVPEDTSMSNITMPEDLVIQKNDVLTIAITSLSPDAAAIYSPGNVLVNSDGNIQIPTIGNIKAAGITKNELRQKISSELTQRKLLVDPTVTISFVNTRIVVLGEVGHPGVLPFSNERLSIIEAIGLAGDLPFTADKQNVLLVREENGKKIFRHLDLSSRNIFASPYYYLKSNDVVYVQPTKAKIKSTTEPRIPAWITFGISTLSLLVGLVVIFKK